MIFEIDLAGWMIRSLRDRNTQRLAADEDVPRFRHLQRAGRRKIALLAAATSLDDLRSPPGNRLEALRGDRVGQHSIRINLQFRICFRWVGHDAHDVQVVDYHD